MAPLTTPGKPLKYPVTRRDNSVIDDFHGDKIADPYRWLEDPEAEEVKEFVEQQVALANSVLETCELKGKLQETITKLADFPRYDAPFKRANKYFYLGNTGLQDQNVLYVQDGLEGTPEVLLDPNTLSEDRTVSFSMGSIAASEDAKYVAYGLSSRGSDWSTIKVIRVDDKTAEPDTIKWSKFSRTVWTRDNKGFFYLRYAAPRGEDNLDAEAEYSNHLYHQLCYHFLGTDQSEDILCWKDLENPGLILRYTDTDDGKYIVLHISDGSDLATKVYYCDISALPKGLGGFKGITEQLPFMKLIDTFEARFVYVANDGTSFTFLTNKDAPKYKLVQLDLNDPSKLTDLIPELEKDVLESAVAVSGDKVIVSYLSDVKCVLQVRDLKTGELLHQLPIGIGAVSAVSGRREDDVVFIDFTSFLTPCIMYECHLGDGVPEMKIFRETRLPGIERSEFKVDQVFVPSKDGTVKIPMFIIGSKNAKLDGSNPCLLFGYGGYGISLNISFSFGRMAVARHLGAIFCVVNIRGGGEYGKAWHEAGSRANKQNSFDDFISCSEYLVSAGYTQPQKLCIEGGSNGGLLIAACINQRPDLFGCALLHGAVTDMLRFHKFTVAHAWTPEYGCSENKEDFQWLIKYSPLHNVRRPWERYPDKSVQYPSTMMLTADRDDRVVPAHSFKFLATLQYELCTSLENSPQTNPIIARIERTTGGHGLGRPTQKLILESAERYSFMAKMLGATWIE